MRVYTKKRDRRAIDNAIVRLVNSNVLYDWGYYTNNYNHSDADLYERNIMEGNAKSGWFEKHDIDVLHLSSRSDLYR